VPFGRFHFFVTCRNSPRFNWKTCLTHIEIGRNIDYSAPGHYSSARDPSVPRATVYFFERTSYNLLSAEGAYYQSLEDIEEKRQWFNFNRAKEQLYNDTMAKLGLKYRFKCVFEFPNTSHEVHSVMIRSDPPTAELWDDNCAHLFAIGELGKPRSCLFFCNFQTRYDEYWELIRCIYSFGLKYFSLDKGKVTTHCGFDFSKKMHTVVNEVYRKTAEQMGLGEYESLLSHVRSQLQILSTAAEDYLEWDELHRYMEGIMPVISYSRLRYYYRAIKRTVSSRLIFLMRDLYMHFFERWKVREPLVYDGLPIPNNVSGCLAYDAFM
jgi:hypothetical protein